ncbi:zinc finger BED domain-containing protein 4-like [Hyperolius riggenbachi]|uniref:zinc finger BED domain-containing protein 4-like n=1 Tax=Hyperolius riggenbachi TaxID=752182 RepID=UPI0035A3221B
MAAAPPRFLTDDYADDDMDITYEPEHDESDASSEESEASWQRRQLGHRHTRGPSGNMSSSASAVQGRQELQSQPPAETPMSRTGSGTTATSGINTSRRKAPVWKYFTESTSDPLVVVCKLCSARLSLGKHLKRLGTGALHTHLKSNHQKEYGSVKGPQSSTMQRTIAQTRPPSHPASVSEIGTHPACSPSVIHSGRRGQISPSSTPSSAQSTQPLITEAIRSTRALPPRSRRIRRLNGLLAEAMVQQLLPYSIVEKGSAIRNLLEYAIPEWQIPSRHYFSRRGIPNLYRRTVDNVALSLDYSIGDRVHLTMDGWTSKHGQGRYVSFTAHWVTLHSEQEGSGPGASIELVEPPRGVKGNRSALTSAGDSTATAEPPNKRPRCYTGVCHKRCQALLELVSIGEQRLTAANVLALLQEQAQKWLTPRRLQLGHVACDNAANLLAALNDGNIPHVPCFAHVLNLVVHRFLRTLPGMSDVVQHARKISGRMGRSSTATSLFRRYQRKHGLPPHRLIVDTPTRWNSTLYMLERMVEQKKAVSEYLLEQDDIHRSSAETLPYITREEWRLMQQVCHVLAPFEQATTFVSGEQVSLSDVLPVVFMLEQTLSSLMTAGEEAVTELELQQQSSLQGSQAQTQEEEEEDVHVMEDIMEVPDHGEEEEEAGAASVIQGWGDLGSQEEQQQQEEDLSVLRRDDDGDLAERALAFPMAAHMIRCLRMDPQIKKIKKRDDYWLATLLDPRCKGKLGQFIPTSQQEERMGELQQALIDQLKEAFPHPQPENPAIPAHGAQQVPMPSRPRHLGDLFGAMRQFYSSESVQPTTASAAAPGNQEQRLSRMVNDYMSSLSASDSMRTEDPMEYWAARLDTCPELAQYALELLSCPPSSVISERAFSAAGGVVTDKRSRLSTDSVNALTFLKINHSWIESGYLAPVVGSRDTTSPL